MEYVHKPVLLQECLEGLNIKPDGIYVDGTLGRAGHSKEIAKRLTCGQLIGIDRDAAALEAAPARLEGLMDRVKLVRGNFSQVGEILHKLGISHVDGMLFDLGVSSPQLDEAARGFSYLQDAPLDMRIDRAAHRDKKGVRNQSLFSYAPHLLYVRISLYVFWGGDYDSMPLRNSSIWRIRPETPCRASS